MHRKRPSSRSHAHAGRRHALRQLGALTLGALALDAQATGSAPANPHGRTWAVGPGLPMQRVADALRQARDGDTITVAPGTYRADVGVITQRALTIVGLGERPLLLADGAHAEGKAIWVVRGGEVRIENIALAGCRVPSRNGAGIRFERGRLTLRRCLFHDNQMGLLTSNDGTAEIAIEDCEFRDAPHQTQAEGLPHLLYLGRIARASIRGSRFSRGFEGHLIKSRAAETLIEGNWIDDGPSGQASYEIDLPNGGRAVVARNTIGQSAATRNPVMLSFGAEGQPWPNSALLLLDNRFVNRLGAPAGVPVRVWMDRLPPATPVHSQGNRWLGGGVPELGASADSRDDAPGPLPAE